jgi:hypothetical protein
MSEDCKLCLASLEHAFLQKNGTYAPIIPPGEYNCMRTFSHKFGYDVFLINNVPGHDYVEIHVGNRNADSEGCILIGLAEQSFLDGECIVNSRIAFTQFMELQSGVNSFKLTVR